MTHCPHCRTPIAMAVQPTADVRAIGGKSTETEAQELRIVAALRTGPKTTDDLRRLGIYQASARIFGLRRRGYVVETVLFDGYSADGYSHARMARYTLKEESLPQSAKQGQEGPQQPQEGGEAACS